MPARGLPTTQPRHLAGRRFSLVVVGSSAGGLDALIRLLEPLGSGIAAPILVAQHLHKDDGGRFVAHLNERVAVPVLEATDKMMPQAGCAYTAPADYHLLLERDGSLSLSIDARVNWSRPSVDVLFESAAWACGDKLLAVVLSGANDDGARGCQAVDQRGGACVIQEPTTAEAMAMPEAALAATPSSTVLPPREIGRLLKDLDDGTSTHHGRGA